MKPVILTFAGHYLPGYKAGGPIRSLSNMIDQLGDEFDFRIAAADRDLGDKEPYDGIVTDVWTPLGKAWIFYRSPDTAGWRALLASLETIDFDLIYLNSFFSTASLRPLIYRRLGWMADLPILLAPRGEFSAGALTLKRLKKHLFIGLSRLLRLHGGVTFQASSDHEADDIRRALGPVRVAVAMALSGRSRGDLAAPARRRPGARLRVVFLSRISPMKNLVGALDILGRVGSTAVDFDIHGVIEDTAYWAACQAAMARLPDHVRVRHKGPVHPDEVETVLGGYDLFLFPTLGENYGHVIREALSAGVPVLISDQTPWRGLDAKGAGADLPLDAPDAFADWIEALARTSDAERAAMRAAARALGDDPVAAEASRQANRDMLLAALHQTA